jgi:HlyD family secretion protein
VSSSSVRWRPRISLGASIRAPQDGVVHQLAVHTVGGNVTPGDPIMLIVPAADALSVETKVWPQDIDQLHLGQSAGLRFSAFNQRTTPEINGMITRISADVSQEEKSGQSYYTIRISISALRRSPAWATSSWCPGCRSRHS